MSPAVKQQAHEELSDTNATNANKYTIYRIEKQFSKKYDESVDRREDSIIFYEHYRTPCGKKMVTRVQVVTASQVQTNGCRWLAILSCPQQTIKDIH